MIVRVAIAVDNHPRLMTWLSHKSYLKDLEAVGVPIVPTLVVDREETLALIDLFYRSEFGLNEAGQPGPVQVLLFDPAHDEPLVKVLFFPSGEVRAVVNSEARDFGPAGDWGITNQDRFVGFW